MLLVTTGENIFRLIVVLAIFIGVLAITVFATRWIASYQRGLTKNTNFDVIDAISVGTSQRLQIIKVGKERYFIIGVGKEEITFISEISEDELLKKEPAEFGGGKNFAEIFEKLNNHSQK